MSIFSPSRCVLLLSDEGVGIYDSGPGRVLLVEIVPWDTQDFEDAVSDIISKRCRGKTIVILNDMVEQHYRKERVPRASPLDKMSIIKRRVTAAFPSFPIRAAMKLKEKAPARDADSAAADIYLFAAVPLSENISKILEAVQRTHAPIGGFSLLPVESSSMVRELSRKLLKGAEKPAIWTVFVGQHRSGGLRQVVTKNGELALTRMTPIVDTDVDYEQWSSDVAGELRGTMGYLSRFGFDPRDGLDIIVIASNSAADKIAEKVDFDCNLNILTATEAANLLKVRLGRQDELRYADTLHVAWTARKSVVSMPLRAAALDKIAIPGRIALAASILLFGASLYFAYTTYNAATLWNENIQKLKLEQKNLEGVRQEHAAEIEKKKSVGIDFLLIEKSTRYYAEIDKATMRPLPVLDLIARALGPDLHLASLDIKPYVKKPGELDEDVKLDELGNPIVPEGPPKPDKFEIVLGFSFPPSLAVEQGVRQITELENRLKNNLPRHEVSVIKQVADLSYTGNFVGETTSQVVQAIPGEKKQDYEAQILIKGELR